MVEASSLHSLSTPETPLPLFRKSHPSTLVSLLLSRVLLVLPVISFLASMASADPCASRRKVIVIGAGISGASAAHALATSSSGCFQVTVLEARSRVGGRMFSQACTVPGLGMARAELGGQWIHGHEGNPIYALAKRFNLSMGSENDNVLQFTAQGARYSDTEFESKEKVYQDLRARALKYANDQDRDLSVDEAFRKVDQKLYLSPYIQSRVAVDYAFDYGGLEDLSAWYHDGDEVFPGSDVLVLDGYDNIPKGLMKEAQGAGAILRLDFVVTRVAQRQQGKDAGVTVWGKPAKGGKPVAYHADFAIVTVPLGVLKAGVIKFSPALSGDKAGAIQRLGFGMGLKVAFFYRSSFWDTSADEFNVESVKLPTDYGRFPYWRNLRHPEGQKAVMGYAIGAYARRMRKRSANLVRDARQKLGVMFPRASLPENKPLAVWVKHWGDDVFARGMYSYAKVGVKGNEYDTMALPEGRVLFAGEHTYGKYRSTVHGAYLSGRREAQRLLDNTVH